MSLRAVQRIRPQHNEIMICTGIEVNAGAQYHGDLAT